MASDTPMLNVGWLATDHSFPTGDVSSEFINCLILMAAHPKNLLRGVHDCEFCNMESPVRIPATGTGREVVSLGMGELHVTSRDGPTYSAPSLIVHYVIAHNYLPPQEFIDAVLRSCDTADDG